MMKLLAYLKIQIKGIVREFPVFFLAYAMYPIILALLMGFIQKDMFTPIINDPIFSIIIIDEDNTDESQGLIAFLSSEELAKVMTVKSHMDEKFDYTLRIPRGYKESLEGKTLASVIVDAEEKARTSLGNILVNMVDKYNIEISQRLVIKRNIENNSLPKEIKDALASEINTILNKVYLQDSIENNIYKVNKSLNSYEYFSVSFLSFAFIMFIIAIIAGEAMGKEIGLYNRIMSTAISRFEYFNYELMSNYFTMIVINIMYVFSYRFTRLSFQGSLSLLLLIVLAQSLMITMIGTLISTIFKKKYGLPLVQIYLIFQVVLGGMIGPLDKWNGNKVFVFFAKYKPDILITNTFRNYIINGNLSSISNYLLIMLGVSLGLYLVNIVIVQMKWGVER